jgi:hypothetical protein
MSDQLPVCSYCGQQHGDLPFTCSANFPDSYTSLSVEERESRAVQTADQCVIDNEQFYIRGCIEIPIRGTDGVFLWGVWARVNDDTFQAVKEHWDRESRETLIGPYEGFLANSLSIYPQTLALPLKIQIMPVGVRPLFHIEDANHSLGIEQRYGITAEHAQEYACHLARPTKS